MARIYTEKEFEKFTRHYTAGDREKFRKMLVEEGRLIAPKGKSQEAQAYEDEDALLDEIMNGEDTEPQQQKKEADVKLYPSIKLRAGAVTRKINEEEFERLFWNLTDDERRAVRTDLILDDKLDVGVGLEKEEKVKVMTDAEIDEIANL